MPGKFIPMFEYVLMVAFNKFSAIKSQKGVTMIEYALIGSLVSIAVIVGLTATGTNLEKIYNDVATKIAQVVANMSS